MDRGMRRPVALLASAGTLTLFSCTGTLSAVQQPPRVNSAQAQATALAYAEDLSTQGLPAFYAAFYEGLRVSAVAQRFGILLQPQNPFATDPTAQPQRRNVNSVMFQDIRSRASIDAMLQTTTIWLGEPAPELQAVAAVIGGGQGLCTGTLIAPNAVLTASHCGCKGQPKEVVFGPNVNSTTRVAVQRFERMVTGCTERDLANGDVAIAFIQQQNITPMAIADLSWVQAQGKLMVAGYGRTNQKQSGTKMKAEVPIITVDCQGNDSNVYGCTQGREAVAGGFAEPDTCPGDSGGPAIWARNNRQYVAAATSRGIRNRTQDCGEGGIYVRLDGAALKWIRNQGVAPQVGGL